MGHCTWTYFFCQTNPPHMNRPALLMAERCRWLMSPGSRD
jgi:hypothetical protein